MTERRAQPRLLDSDLIILCWDDGSSRHKQLGKLNDVSDTGVGILVDYPLPIGASVTFSYGSRGQGELSGVVRHHTRQDNGHVIGIEI